METIRAADTPQGREQPGAGSFGSGECSLDGNQPPSA